MLKLSAKMKKTGYGTAKWWVQLYPALCTALGCVCFTNHYYNMRMLWECCICFSLNTNVFSFLSQNGFTPLSVASQNGHSETVQLLLSRGANVNLQEKVDMLPSIFLYLRWKEAGNTECSPLSTCTGVCCLTPVVDSLYSTHQWV